MRFVGKDDVRVRLRPKPVIAQHVRHHIVKFRQMFAQFGGAVRILFLRKGCAQGVAPLFKHGRQVFADILRKMQGRRLALTHVGKKIRFTERRRGRHVPARGKRRGMPFVPGSQQLEHIFAHPVVDRGISAQRFRNVAATQQFVERLGSVCIERGPCEFHQLVAERGLEFYADAHRDAHDARSPQQFLRGFGVNRIIIDDRKKADALDPGIHDKMRGIFASLGVGVVNMVVKGVLVPGLGHFQ